MPSRIPPDPETFNLTVYKITKQIPQGCVSTYGQIASMIPPPAGVDADDYARMGAVWVGQALNQTPDGPGIPWQRVINSKGGISLPGRAADQQRRLLEAEGVEFRPNDTVSLATYGWDGPDSDWLDDNALLPPIRLKTDDDGPQQLTLL